MSRALAEDPVQGGVDHADQGEKHGPSDYDATDADQGSNSCFPADRHGCLRNEKASQAANFKICVFLFSQSPIDAAAPPTTMPMGDIVNNRIQ